tara:strand:- start:2518 stop:4920 length:2403 start_codon:yes stop_codon:yes gene_type:complete
MSYQRKKTLSRYGTQFSGPTVTNYTFPASVGGINAASSLLMMPPEDAIYIYNLMPSEYGMRLRKGYREWAINCVSDNTLNNDVKTILPFESNSRNLAFNRLFAVTSEGIWNVTNSGELNPTLAIANAWTLNDDPAGYGVSCEFTNDANQHYMFYADGLNGLWQYVQNTSQWTQPVSGTGDTEWYTSTGPNPGDRTPFPVNDIVFVMVFKQRIWVILEDDSDAYYLPIASISGQLTKFVFGAKMPHGGNLQGLYNWTLDSGIGVDDMLVAISRGGDVIIYQGADPEAAAPDVPFGARGIFFIGETPASRRIAVDYGPDLYILSTYGLVSLNTLLRGEFITGQSPSKKISRFLREDVESGKNSSAWQIVVNPSDGFLQIITPASGSDSYLQYNMNTETQGWGFWEGVPILGANSFSGEYYMGGENGVVYIYDGAVDGVTLPGSNIFQNNPVSAPAEWTVVSDDFICDGSQIVETEYKVDLILPPLEVGVEYVVIYYIKANAAINLWTNNAPNPQPVFAWTASNSEYFCNGTQTSEAKYEITTTLDFKAGFLYTITFKGISGSGLYKLAVGNEDVSEWNSGDEVYSFSFTPTVDANKMSIIGNVSFNGFISDISATLSDGAGLHSVSIGAELMATPSAGSGIYSHNFIATAPNTQMALVGNADFQGTFYNVSLNIAGNAGIPISFRSLTSFQAPVGHANFNRVGFIRTIGLLAGSSSVTVKAIYDYDISEYIAVNSPVSSKTTSGWNSAVWDLSKWDGSLRGQSFTDGASGIGRSFAVGMQGNSNTRINILGWDVLFNTGGFL